MKFYHSLKFISTSDPTDVSVSPSVLVRGFNERGDLVCTGFGIPRPQLSWRGKDGQPITNNENFTITTSILESENGYNTSTLTFLNTHPYLEGDYTCIGENNVENLIEASNEDVGEFLIEGCLTKMKHFCNNSSCSLVHMVFFFLLAAPSVRAINATLTGLKGKEITLRFEVVHAAPLVVPEGIAWMFGTSVINESDNRFQFSEDRLSLTISDLEFDDDGTYHFTATNVFGHDTKSLVLTVDGKKRLIGPYVIFNLIKCK